MTALAGLGDLPRPLEDVLARMHHIGETPRPDCDIFDGSGMDIWEKASWAPWKWLEGIIERYESDLCQRIPTMCIWLNSVSMQQGSQTCNQLGHGLTCTAAWRF